MINGKALACKILPFPKLRHWLTLRGHDAEIVLAKMAYFFYGKQLSSLYDIPIYINNYNRLYDLLKLIESLEKRNYHNIHIIDNCSTYPPLLSFYERCKYDVIRLKENNGYLSIWETGIYKACWRSYYVYTDADVVLDDSCPDDFMLHLIQLFKKYPLCHKVGLGIHIDDLPDCFNQKKQVIQHESQFWEHQIEDGVYKASVDTTFALYRPFCTGPAHCNKLQLRTGTPYLIHHLPWYVDSQHLSEEDSYYLDSVTKSTEWSSKMKDNNRESCI